MSFQVSCVFILSLLPDMIICNACKHYLVDYADYPHTKGYIESYKN